ncbi:GntR family transcriptional regulator [Bacillus sp. HNG]|uniref:GntR family transcriptional regulator n=1 Tax=Bacillus sp. HNG TaxID=2293325 RepID=UPI000E2FAE94|nr:GntR family transcriptional regulator [Bacillus sp. HNG]RFB17388.1 GntR family transcriptional regulator [Bacillus sp. HNG]
MKLPGLESVERQPLNVIVYEKLKSSIVNGDIEPGTRITEATVSKQLNVSSTPVREAFRKLSAEGLITIVPWKGAIVQEFTSKQIQDVYQCRTSLEELAVELAIPRMDEDGIKQLKECVKKSMTCESHTEYVELNTKLHDLIYEYADNPTLMNLYNQIKDVVINNRIVTSYSEERKKQIIQEHEAIIKYIELKDIDNAKQAVRDHIIKGYNHIKTRFEK